jgi:hypothetical protein
MTSFSVGIALKANAKDAHTGCSARVGLLMKQEREIRDYYMHPSKIFDRLQQIRLWDAGVMCRNRVAKLSGERNIGKTSMPDRSRMFSIRILVHGRTDTTPIFAPWSARDPAKFHGAAVEAHSWRRLDFSIHPPYYPFMNRTPCCGLFTLLRARG